MYKQNKAKATDKALLSSSVSSECHHQQRRCKYFGGFSGDKIRRRLRRAEKFMADIRRTKIRRRIRCATLAEGLDRPLNEIGYQSNP
jgi:adenylylsulfate kinase-like enzyme